MARNEDGEFELVLGNKQLLSVFFLVVVLLGVFFTMGYIVGRNSAPITASAEQPPSRKDSGPIVVEPSPARQSRPAPQAEQLSPGQVHVSEPAAKPATAPDTPKPEAAVPASGLLEPQSGQTYLQVLATARTEADLVAESLRKKGYAAQVTPGPTPNVFRVYVGPFPGTEELSQAREGLVAAGFAKPIVRSYK